MTSRPLCFDDNVGVVENVGVGGGATVALLIMANVTLLNNVFEGLVVE